MPDNWTQPEPGRYESVQPDGSLLVEQRTITEAFRQGDLLSSTRLPAPDSAPALTAAIAKAAKAAPKKRAKQAAVKKPAPKRKMKPKARKR
jgi:predicted alternative tryptophan synthase beta-subunit